MLVLAAWVALSSSETTTKKQPAILGIPQPKILRQGAPPPPARHHSDDEDPADSNPQQQQLSVNRSNVHYHIVFSTGCSLYQDWQSFVFFYQAMVVQQPGTVTRIVSGCNEEDQATLQGIFDDQIRPMAPERFKIHFTPDFSGIKGGPQKFVYFNKVRVVFLCWKSMFCVMESWV